MKTATTILALVLLGLTGGTAWSATVLKIATVAPEGSDWMNGMRAAAGDIKQATEGRVELKLYGGGVMGTDRRVLRKIHIGQLSGGALTASGISDEYSNILIYGLPLLFKSMDEVDYVRQRIDPLLKAGLEKAGYQSFGFAGGGFARLMSADPITHLDDLKGRKVWVPEGDAIGYAAMERLGLTPVTLPMTDVLTGLQTGLVDVIASSPVGALVMQWHTKVSYMTDVPASYVLGFMVVANRDWNRIDASDQPAVRRILERTYKQFDASCWPDDEGALAAMKQSGVKVVEPDPAEVSQWRQQLVAMSRDLAKQGVLDPAVLEQVLSDLQAYRAGDAGQASAASAD